MRGKVAGLAVLVILLGSVPIRAQVRVPVAPAAGPPPRPVLIPGRIMRYVPPSPSPVRAISPPVRAVRVQPLPPLPSPASANSEAGPAAPTFAPATAAIGGTPIPIEQLLNEAPGLGFDFNHLAAINSNLAVRAIIDPLTRQELALAEQLPQEQPVLGYFPFFGGGVPYEAAPSQPQVIVIQEPVQQTPAAFPPPPPPPQAALPPVPPVPVNGEFLLVERDGTVIHAIAFSQHGSQVVYITSEGQRRSIALDRLDVKSTEERNAERGAFLRFSD